VIQLNIPFNKPYFSSNSIKYIEQVIYSGKTGGDGKFTNKCKKLLERTLIAKNVIMTTSCTHALELAIQLINLQDMDEVIMPSYTFPSTANSVLLNGGKVVFTEINKDDLCINANKIEEKITNKTKAIVVVHYGGNACDMDKIMNVANKYNLYVIEDVAQGFLSTYKERQLGTIGHFGCLSFHETKNVSAGEGGAIIINSNNEELVKRAKYIRQKGTNRIDFELGNVDYYQWVDVGSSYCPSEILMAYLYSQLENIEDIHIQRRKIFNNYVRIFRDINSDKITFYSKGNKFGDFNAHIFYIIFKDQIYSKAFIERLKNKGIAVYTHLIPLHLSEMGLSIGYNKSDFPYEQFLYKRLIRLPIYYDITDEELDKIEEAIRETIH
jgi:dTDP-4-amino-4,6-dideoxygalactose transaminase